MRITLLIITFLFITAIPYTASADNNNAADGKDGTSFAIRKGSVRCMVEGNWDGGDDSDPSYIPGDEYEVSVGCVLDEK